MELELREFKDFSDVYDAGIDLEGEKSIAIEVEYEDEETELIPISARFFTDMDSWFAVSKSDFDEEISDIDFDEIESYKFILLPRGETLNLQGVLHDKVYFTKED
jgi:hypothetical protein